MIAIDHGGAGRAAATILAPPPDLDRLVEYFWIQGPRPVARWWVVPDASAHLMAAVTARPDRCRAVRTALVGARSAAAPVETAGRVLTVGARLRPGALPALVRTPAVALTDRSTLATEAFTPAVLRDLEIGPDTPAPLVVAEIARLIRHAVARQDARRLDAALEDAASVAALAAHLQLTPRALHRRAIDGVGLGPKQALRVIRLQRALLTLSTPGRPSIAAAAHAAGFSDQAHFARDCRDLLGMSATAWLVLGADSFKPDPVPIE